jgi:uncharacterized protein (DUF305 family)
MATTAGAGAAAAQTEGGSGTPTLSPTEFEAAYRARRDSARMRFTEADVEFVTGMIGHHAQALIMSDMAPTHGASPQVQILAARIINAQQDEIALMQRWLRDRGQPVPEVTIDGLNLTLEMSEPDDSDSPDEHMKHDADQAAPGLDMHADHDMHAAAGGHDHLMPGMLTQLQLEELDAAFGSEFDRLFLTGMIAHHGGAVLMVHDLFAVDGAGQDDAVFKLASDIQVDQITEIARMELMLEEYTD